jgi:hypothetical protein
MLSFWHTSSISAFSLSLSADFLVDHRPIILTNCPTVRVGSRWPSANHVDCSPLPSIGRLHSVFHQLPLFILLTYFSKKQCQHVPPSFGVNNLLLRNFLEFVISLDSKSATGCQQIFGVTNTVALVLSFSPKFCYSNSSSFSSDEP